MSLKQFAHRWSNEGKKIVVIGDSILDQFEFGKVTRLSSESEQAPVLSIKARKSAPGGAANAAANIASLEGDVSLVTVMGDDHTAENLKQIIRNAGIQIFTTTDPDRPTTRKQRFYDNGSEKFCAEWQDRDPISETIENGLLANLKNIPADIIVVSDYGRGVITKTLMEKLMTYARINGIKVLSDVRPRNDWRDVYQGVFLLKPNWLEAGRLTEMQLNGHETVAEAGRMLARSLHVPNVLITRGKEGMSLIEKGEDIEFGPFPFNKRAVCVSGAGDTVIATIALALSVDAPLQDACRLACATAAIAISKPGTSTVEKQELFSALDLS